MQVIAEKHLSASGKKTMTVPICKLTSFKAGYKGLKSWNLKQDRIPHPSFKKERYPLFQFPPPPPIGKFVVIPALLGHTSMESQRTYCHDFSYKKYLTRCLFFEKLRNEVGRHSRLVCFRDMIRSGRSAQFVQADKHWPLLHFERYKINQQLWVANSRRNRNCGS